MERYSKLFTQYIYDSRLWSYLLQHAQRRVERLPHGRPPDRALEGLDDHGRHPFVELCPELGILRHVRDDSRRERVLHKRVRARRRAQRSFHEVQKLPSRRGVHAPRSRRVRDLSEEFRDAVRVHLCVAR